MFIVTPALLIGFAGGKTVGLVEKIAESGSYSQVQNGAQVEVSDSGALSVLISPASDDAQCYLSKGEDTTELNTRSSFQGTVKKGAEEKIATVTVLSKSGLEPNSYTLDCTGIAQDAKLNLVDPTIAAELTKTIATAAIVSVLTGVTGLVLLIAGVVWMLLVWRKRNQIKAMQYNTFYGNPPANQQYGQPPYGGYQQPPHYGPNSGPQAPHYGSNNQQPGYDETRNGTNPPHDDPNRGQQPPAN